MNDCVKNLVEVYFKEIPFSTRTVKAKKDIEAALDKEYELIKTSVGEENALDELILKYPRLVDMARLAGYTKNDCANWRRLGLTTQIKALKKYLRTQRTAIYISALAFTFAFYELIQSVFWFSTDNTTDGLTALIFVIIPAALGAFLLNGFYKNEAAAKNDRYDTESFTHLCLLYDKYLKRRQNCTALFCMAVGLFAVLETALISISKPDEVWESLKFNSIIILLPLFLLLKNHLCYGMIYRRIRKSVKPDSAKHFLIITLFSAIYWIIALAFMLFQMASRQFDAVAFSIASGIAFAVMILLYNLIFRKQIAFKNITVNMKRISVVTAAAILVSGYAVMNRDTWYTQPYINSIPVVKHEIPKITYDDATGVYSIVAPEDDFRILHLTDIHLGGSLASYSKDLKALDAVYTEIAYAKPDLVIVTGDLCFPLGILSFSLNNMAPFYQFAAFMRNTNIPWAFTYGNHDTELIASASKWDINEVLKSLSFKTSANLLYPYTQPEIYGRSNQLIKVLNSDGSLNTALFLIDSNDYTGNGINDYDYIHNDQVNWYRDEVTRLCNEQDRVVPSMVFFHIPLQQYKTAYELYIDGSDEVKYFFGENNEKMIDKICCSDYPSTLFDTMVELGSTKAVFCGHDHYNNMSLEYQGIRLTYGMSIDYLAMPGIENDVLQRGAELITIHKDGSFGIEQIPLHTIQ